MAKLYVGYSLTQAPQEFRDNVEVLKNLLRLDGHEVLNFLGLNVGDPTDVYESDIHRCVAECEMMLAICDFPATALGWEMGTAVERHRKPVLAVAHVDAKVSRLLIGADCERNPHYGFARYSKWEEIPASVSLFLKMIRVGAR